MAISEKLFKNNVVFCSNCGKKLEAGSKFCNACGKPIKIRGKDKCELLKELRKKVAELNDITYKTTECNHTGDCEGTCPMCDKELEFIANELRNIQFRFVKFPELPEDGPFGKRVGFNAMPKFDSKHTFDENPFENPFENIDDEMINDPDNILGGEQSVSEVCADDINQSIIDNVDIVATAMHNFASKYNDKTINIINSLDLNTYNKSKIIGYIMSEDTSELANLLHKYELEYTNILRAHLNKFTSNYFNEAEELLNHIKLLDYIIDTKNIDKSNENDNEPEWYPDEITGDIIAPDIETDPVDEWSDNLYRFLREYRYESVEAIYYFGLKHIDIITEAINNYNIMYHDKSKIISYFSPHRNDEGLIQYFNEIISLYGYSLKKFIKEFANKYYYTYENELIKLINDLPLNKFRSSITDEYELNEMNVDKAKLVFPFDELSYYISGYCDITEKNIYKLISENTDEIYKFINNYCMKHYSKGVVIKHIKNRTISRLLAETNYKHKDKLYEFCNTFAYSYPYQAYKLLNDIKKDITNTILGRDYE